MTARMGDELALELTLQGRLQSASAEVAQLVALAERVAALPDPHIDPKFAARLEARLMAEVLDSESDAPQVLRPVSVEPEPARPAQPARRAPVIPLPRRRIVLRKTLVAAAAAMMAMAFPIVASASSLPESPLYGLKLGIENVRCGLASGVSEGFCRLGTAGTRLAETRQLVALGRAGVGAAVSRMQAQQKAGAAAIMDSGDTTAMAKAADVVARQTGALATLLPSVSDSARSVVMKAVADGQVLSSTIAAALGNGISADAGRFTGGLSGATVPRSDGRIATGGSSAAVGQDGSSGSTDGSVDGQAPDQQGPRAPAPPQTTSPKGGGGSGQAYSCIFKSVNGLGALCDPLLGYDG